MTAVMIGQDNIEDGTEAQNLKDLILLVAGWSVQAQKQFRSSQCCPLEEERVHFPSPRMKFPPLLKRRNLSSGGKKSGRKQH